MTVTSVLESGLMGTFSLEKFVGRMKKDGMTRANAVTCVRILMAVAVLVLLIVSGPSISNLAERWSSAVLFIIAAATDKLDGYLARSRNEVTVLGKFLDPIADKLLICSCMVVLSCFGTIWWWVTILFLAREAWITALRLYAKKKRGVVSASDFLGKLKTVFECVAIGMILSPLWDTPKIPVLLALCYYYLMMSVLGVSLVLCLASGASYTFSIFSQIRESKNGK